MGLFDIFGIGGGTKSSNSTTNSNYNFNGTQTPILSPQWTGTFANASGNVNPNGFTPSQTTGSNYFAGLLSTNPSSPSAWANPDPLSGINNATRNTTTDLAGLSNEYGLLNVNGLGGQAGGTNFFDPSQIPSAGAANAGQASTGASMASPYASLYSSALVNPSLAAFDYGTDRNMSALDARNAGAGAFGNTRSGLGYSDLGAQAALGRGQLASQLLNTGLTNAIGFGQTDASRMAQNNQFNAGLQQQTNIANLGAQMQGRQQQLQAAQQWAQNIGARTGISQQVLNNIVSANGNNINVDMSAAQQLLQTGAITQDQLLQLVQAAAQANGMASQGSGTSNSTTKGSSSDLNFSLGNI